MEIAALVTRDSARSAAVLRDLGSAGRPFGSVPSMITEMAQVDRVIVCAQPADQLDIVRELLGAGKHVLAEKPLGRNADEAAELAALAESKGVVLRAAFMKRHAPAIARLRELANDPELGDLVAFDVRFAADTAAFAATPADFVRLAAIHHVDLILFLVGAIDRLDASMSEAQAGFEISVSMSARSGAIGTFRTGSLRAHTSEVDRVEMVFEHGTLCMVDSRELSVTRAGRDDWRDIGSVQETMRPPLSTMSGGGQDLHLRGFVAEVASFATTQFAGSDAGAHDNVATMHLCDRIVEALGARR